MLEIKEIELVIHDLVGSGIAYIDDYLGLYNELFPEYIRYVPLMRWRAEKPVDDSTYEKWHQWLLVIRDKPIGIIGFLYNKNRNVGVLMDFAIKPEVRKIQFTEDQKLPLLILRLAMQQLVDDSLANGHASPLFMIAEVEHAALLKKYVEYGYLEFPVEYYEPSYPAELALATVESKNLDKMEYKQMYLGAFQLPGHPFDPNSPEIIKTALLTTLVDHYGLSVDHWLIQKMLIEIFG
jgi:hypothetical protein